MPFNDPSPAGGFTEVDSGKYFVKVTRLEDVPEGQFGPQVKWVFELATLQGEVLLDERGFNAEFWAWTSPKITTGGKRPSNAYVWGQALLPGVDLMELTGSEFAAMVVGKKAVALIGQNENGKTRILQMSPMPAADKNAQPAQKTAPAAKTTSKQAEPEAPPDDVQGIEQQVTESEAAAAPW